MNRHQRRAARKIAQRQFYDDYVRHHPQVETDAPFERGQLYHLVVFHDDWCNINKGGGCNCNPIIERYKEPKRS